MRSWTLESEEGKGVGGGRRRGTNDVNMVLIYEILKILSEQILKWKRRKKNDHKFSKYLSEIVRIIWFVSWSKMIVRY